MAEDINELLEKLTFSEEESKRVFSSNRFSTNPKGYKAWAVGKIMSNERINKEAMYRVLRSLWFTKEEVKFVALRDGVILWEKIDVSKPLRRVVYFVGQEDAEIVCTIKYERLPAFCYRQGSNIETKENKERSSEENKTMRVIKKEKTKTGVESESGFPIKKLPTRNIRGEGGRSRCKRKKAKGGNWENLDGSPACLVRRKFLDNISPCKAAAGNQPRQEQ
ncbi:hypothetical protein PVK06_008829 [Gossypium arboreum]|uniref:DUF4283 domain-containing protein n=1 Tax=Gossypium arboreum TaxID=29729 RepID=A0ABR0QL63_GOSAR|nr:hypothetical protein PVK06_008829 [Gossypium arboreum]